MGNALERVCMSISDQFDAVMRLRRITQRKLAWRTGRTREGSVSNVLRARNCTVATLVDLADGLDHDVVVTLVPRVPSSAK
jgi:hypothetical protein